MEMQFVKVGISLSNGSLAIMSFFTQARGDVPTDGAKLFEVDGEGWWTREPTPEAIEAEVQRFMAAHPHLSLVKWSLIDPATIPEGREFRDALREDDGKVSHDMPRARGIHMKRIRARRNEKLAELDPEYMRADEDNDVPKKRAIAAQKRALRDLPATFDLEKAQTVDELTTLWPEELK